MWKRYNCRNVVMSMERKFRMIVTRISESEFSVLSLNSTSGRPKQYAVRWNSYRWICSCPDFARHSEEIDYVCKHIEAMFKVMRLMTGMEIEVIRSYNGRSKASSQV